MKLYENGQNRCEKLGLYLAEHNSTVRETAQHFGISKSTVHKDLREKLSRTNKPLYIRVCAVLEKNKSERHLRGGIATKQKYKKLENKQ